MAVGKTGEVELEGALGAASSAAQTLLLEYVDGKPMSEVGWGRVSKEQIGELLKFHTTKFYFETRTPHVADRIAAPLAERVAAALRGEAGYGRLTMFVGHDTNIAALGGMLDLHWKLPDYAEDDPPPGGALGFELLSRAGKRYVRAFYQAQTMDQLRALTPLSEANPPTLVYLQIPGCAVADQAGCPLRTFLRIVERKLKSPTNAN
ncbi:MAG: histidine-type phosphatase [Alphaproteobacteria bacterium]